MQRILDHTLVIAGWWGIPKFCGNSLPAHTALDQTGGLEITRMVKELCTTRALPEFSAWSIF
jgi:hypothetical protein